MPFSVSSMIFAQSTAARCAGVRATPARKRARYDRTRRAKSAALIAFVVLIQVVGSGKPPAPLATGFVVYARALSSITIAAFATSAALDNGGMESLGIP